MDQETQDKIIQHISEYSDEFKKSMRRQYLLGYYRKAFNKQYLRSKKYISDTVVKTLYYMEMRDKAIDQGDLAAVVIMTDRIKELVTILVKFQNANYYRRQDMGGDVTNEMIRRAKEYDYENLVPTGKNHMGICPFHEDRHPSFSVKNNMGHCFSCGWSGDTIAFLMTKEGLNFPEAVKRLQ